jgi:hypothetical protein
MSKPITYTRHAMTAVTERDLDTGWIEAIVRHPQWTEPDRDDPEVVRYFGAIGARGGRYLRVAVVETHREYRIVSAFLDRSAKPK